MAEPLATFSESWYRVANQRLWLRADAVVRRQNYRGQRWIVLQNPFNSRYFLLRPAAYELVARLRPEKTVQEVWQECIARFPDEAPGQEAVMQLLSQLYFANLLHYQNAADSAQLFERYQRQRQRETRARLLNLMFMRFPLLDPDPFLVRTLPLVGAVIGRAGAVLWGLVVALALKVVVDNSSALRTQGEGVLAPGNLPLLYLSLVLIKTIHEFGHAYFCRRFGGEVHTMGVMLMIFTPIPYMDASSSWGFRNRSQRALVGAAGMIVELFVAGLAVFVWAATGAGVLHGLAYNLIFIASVSTVIFNANPLLRFDGYYILSDLLEIPNLSQRAIGQLRHLWERYLFGVKQSESPAHGRREAAWLVVYGIAAGIYRVIVFSGVLLFVADRFLVLGIIMALVCLISWAIVPAARFLHYLAASPRLQRVRWRASAVTAGLAAAVLALLAVVPFPNHFRAPGIVQARQRAGVVNEVAGVVRGLLAAPGARVAGGQPVVQLENRELELDLRDARAAYDEAAARLLQALSTTNADVKPLRSRLESIANRVAKLEADRAALTVRARLDGIWVAPYIKEMVGTVLARGTALGLVVDPRSFEFVATVKQVDADAAFGGASEMLPAEGAPERAGTAAPDLSYKSPSRPGSERTPGLGAEIRLRGQAGGVMRALRWNVVPGGQRHLPSAALGWMAGGEVPVSPTEPEKAAEPFFEVHASLPATAQPALLHGRSGAIRFDLPAKPLLPRWWRRLEQLVQKRYHL